MGSYHKYTQSDIDYVIAHLKENGYESVAANIGVSTPALKKQMTLWRDQGIDVPRIRWGNKVGAISMRMDRGEMRAFIKTENGWRRMGKKKRIKQKEAPKPKKVRAKKKKTAPAPKHAPKKEKKVFANKNIDLSKKMRVYIPEKRLTVYVNPGTDAEKVRKKYEDHYEFMNKKAVISNYLNQ